MVSGRAFFHSCSSLRTSDSKCHAAARHARQTLTEIQRSFLLLTLHVLLVCLHSQGEERVGLGKTDDVISRLLFNRLCVIPKSSSKSSVHSKVVCGLDVAQNFRR